jgi:hypothetical protein
MPSNAVVLVVISFLAVAFVFSSFSSSFYAFARAKIVSRGQIECTIHSGDYKLIYGAMTCCQTETDQNGLEVKYCTDCQNSTPPYNCGPRHIASGGSGNPPPPQPPKNAPLSSTQQTTCPDGSAPDADGKCPPVTQGDSGNKEKGKNPKSSTDTGGAGLAVSDEGASGKKPVKK